MRGPARSTRSSFTPVPHVNAFRFKGALQFGAHIVVVIADEATAALQQRRLRTDAGEELAQLDRHHAAAQHGQAGRNFLGQERVVRW